MRYVNEQNTILFASLYGCTQAETSSSLTDTNPEVSFDNDSTNSVGANHLTLNDITVQERKRTVFHNEIDYYSMDEVRDIVFQETDYQISDNFHANIPKKLDCIYTFRKYCPEMDSPFDLYYSFLQLYKYLFPDEDLNDRNLFYFGKNSNNQNGNDDVKNINDNFNEFKSEVSENVYYMFYSPYFQPSQKNTISEDNHFLELGNPVGFSLTNFNKGVLSAFISKQNGVLNNAFLETYTDPNRFAPFDPTTGYSQPFSIKSYLRESDDIITLTDGKDISIRDAVEFYEDYINSLPFTKEPNTDITVMSATAIEVGKKGECCLAFLTTQSYKGIPFDYKPYGTYVFGSGDNAYEQFISMGYMSVIDDVDSSYGFVRHMCIEDEKLYNEIIPLTSAVSKCRDSMSEYAEWELLSVEIVYCSKQAQGNSDTSQGFIYDVKPCYKFVLYNEIDSIEYVVYVDALAGELERYYKAQGYREE